MADAEHDYVTGQFRPHFPALLAEFDRRSAVAAGADGVVSDRTYGPHPRQRYDVFPAEGAARARLVYFHAGYWQSRDKAQFRFLAPSLAKAGYEVVLANYPLCPDVRIGEIVAAAAMLPGRLGDALPLIMAGHSAGAQIACELALRGTVAGVLAVSGVFDLGPLVGTSLNARLRLSADEAVAASPIHRVTGALPPALFVVGGAETSAFLEQTRRVAAAWPGSEAIVVAGADHFSVLETLADAAGAVRVALDRLAAGAGGD